VPVGKRQFDRQSGTGRGKEISKGGAGGKYTWSGNDKSLAKEEKNYDEGEDYGNYDDRLFSKALNAKPKLATDADKDKENLSPEKKNIDENTNANVNEEYKVEQPQEGDANANEDWNDKRKKRKVLKLMKKKLEPLARPKDALSYTEYMEQLKTKNQNISQVQKTVAKPSDVNDLKEKTRDNNEFVFGVNSTKTAAKPKPKEKKKLILKNRN